MKIGISGWSVSSFAKTDEFKMIDYVKKFHYHSIDLSLEGSNFDFMNCSLQKVRSHYTRLYRYAKENGIEVFQVHASFVPFPKYLYQDYFDKIVRTIRIASYLHCKNVIMHPLVFPLNKEVNTDEAEKRFNLEFFRRLIPYCKQYGTRICLENIYDWDHKMIRKIYVSDPEHLREYVDELNSEYIGICLDTGHLHLAHRSQKEAIEIFNEKLYALHVHDNYEIKDDHFKMGNGTIAWEDVVQSLRKIHYQGVFNLELKPLSDEESYYEDAYKVAEKWVKKIDD